MDSQQNFLSACLALILFKFHEISSDWVIVLVIKVPYSGVELVFIVGGILGLPNIKTGLKYGLLVVNKIQICDTFEQKQSFKKQNRINEIRQLALIHDMFIFATTTTKEINLYL
ncbi:hypothetical protein ACJX0J_028713 [Zea mays]